MKLHTTMHRLGRWRAIAMAGVVGLTACGAPTAGSEDANQTDAVQMDLFGNDMPHGAMPHTDRGPAQISMF